MALGPAQAKFHRESAGDTEPMRLLRDAGAAQAGAYTMQAVAHSAGHDYADRLAKRRLPGLLPYNQYQPARLKTRKVDVKLAPGLRVGYVMGPGDMVPEAMEAWASTPHLLTAAELATGDLSTWNVIVIGIRAYTTRRSCRESGRGCNEFVAHGGTLVVQYQSGNFPAPLPLDAWAARRSASWTRTAPVKLLDPANPLLTWPNTITPADFDGWVEERGHWLP